MNYIVYTPANFTPRSSAIVMALHPRNGSGLYMEQLTGLNAKADQAGFAVIYPSTPGAREWCWLPKPCTDTPALRAILAAVQPTLNADPKKIYVTGYSDGAEMSHRVGVEMGDVVAAIAPVSGDLYEGTVSANYSVPAAVQPVSVLLLHADEPPDLSFYVCGYTASGGWRIPSQDVVFNYWTGASANDCATFDTSESICSGGSLHLTAKRAGSCKGAAEVRFYQLTNASHGWFNVAGNWSVPMNVPTVGQNYAVQRPYNPSFDATTGVTANDIIWNFFAAHPKQ